ncbi:MAG: hypothetical protein WDW38_010877 [Sanguina aurantia]
MAMMMRTTPSLFMGSPVQKTAAAPFRSIRPASLQVVASHGVLPKIGGGRKWDYAELTPNGRAVRIDMHVKKGDYVQVIAGKDKGLIGNIIQVLPKKGRVVVENVNKLTKNVKAKAEGEQGKQEVKEYPIHHSNVQLYSKEKQVSSRVGHKMNEAGKKVRYLLKTGEIVD